MEENRQMTVQEALTQTVLLLNSLTFTTDEVEKFGTVVMNARNNILLCIDALDRAKKQKEAEETAEQEEPENDE